jgi:hypothetical protein
MKTKQSVRRIASTRLLRGSTHKFNLLFHGEYRKHDETNKKLYVSKNIYPLKATSSYIRNIFDLLVFNISLGMVNDSALEQSSLHCQWWL